MNIKKTLADILGPSIKEREEARKEVKEMSDDVKKDITRFLDDHNKMLVIVADPESDVVVAGYKDYLTANRLVDKNTGISTGSIESMLQYDKEDKKSVDAINNFLLLVDGLVHHIAKKLKGRSSKTDQ